MVRQGAGKKTLVAFALVLALSVLGACTNAPPARDATASEEPTPIPAPAPEAPPTVSYVPFSDLRELGRVYHDEEKECAWFGFTSSGFEFSFSGKGKVEATFLTDISLSEEFGAFIGVFIDNNETASQTILMDLPIKKVVLFECDKFSRATIRIEKLSELKFSDAALLYLTTTGIGCEVKPTAPRDMLIEFIGDSITSGYGLLTNEMSGPFTTRAEDGSRTYSAITARHFGADLRVVSYAGAGVFHSNTAGPTNDEVPLIGDIYLAGDIRRSDAPWDFPSQQPADFIVINIGTNDGVKIDENPELYGPEFGEAYFSFLGEVRALNPDAFIISALGPMAFTSEDYLFPAWQRFAREDKNTRYLRFDGIDIEEDGIGSAGHPTLATHEKMAAYLIRHIGMLRNAGSQI